MGRRPRPEGRVTDVTPQIAVYLTPETFPTVEGMAQATGASRAEIVRQLVDQGLVALRAAAAAEDDGADLAGVNTAVIEAIRQTNLKVDEAVMVHMLDLTEDYLQLVAKRRPWDAVRLALGAGTMLTGWGDALAETLRQKGRAEPAMAEKVS